MTESRTDKFLKYLELKGVSLKSLKYYKSDLTSFLTWAGVKKIEPKLIQEYINSIRAFTPVSTLNRRISTLKSYGSFMGFKKVSSTWQDNILSKFGHKPKFQNILHKLFFSRPNWYRRYHAYPLASYIHIAILVLFTSLSGYALYDQVFRNPENPLAFPTALTRPNRYLSFQGRLTSNVGNPITVATNLVFKLYDASTAGTELWTSGTCAITPDQDGIFSTLLGSSCGAEIAATVFSENASVWVGVTVAADAEATPRVQIATVAYALNSETLQGYPAGTGTSTIPYIGSTGILVLANASPKIQSTSGTFAVEGLAMTITTPNASEGVITINPDGVGTLDLTFEGAAAGLSANGFVNATNANITSGALYGGTVASAATGYNFIDFQSGVSPASKFSVSGAGNTYIAGTLGVGGTPAATALLDLTSTTKGFLAPRMDTTQRDAITTPATGLMIYNTSDNQYNVFNGTTWGAVGGGGGAWSDITLPTDNLAFSMGGYTTAFTWTGGGKFAFDTNGNLGIGTNSATHAVATADVLISSDLEIDGVLYMDGGLIANSAGTTSIALSATPTTVANTLSASNWLIENTANVGQAALIINQQKAGDLFTASASGTPKFTIANTAAITSAIGNWTSQVADSATAVGFTFNTSNTLSTQGSKLLSFQNLGTEKMYLDKDGNLYVSGTVVSGNGTSMLLTNKSGGIVASKAIVVLDTSNNTSFTTTTTPYSKLGFGVVVGVGLGVTNDADGDGVCDANDICMIAYGGSVNVTVKNATTAVKGDYLFTSDTAGSAVASAKQYDGLVGIVDDTTNAASGYLRMIFKVQPQVTAAAAIDKTTKHNEYWLYADQYQAVGEGSNTDTNLLQRGLAFDTFTDSTKTDSANTTASFDTNTQKTGLIGGQTLATSTTDNDGQTYLGSNTVNDTYYYDRVKLDSAAQVQVELGIDPNWYNGVTLSVATTSAQFSQNSVITQPNPNLSTTYNGSLIKVTGTDSTPRTIYITIKSPTTFDWTNYNGQAATGVTITPGTAQALGSTGVSATFTNARYNTGDVFKIASWFIEAESSTRGAKQQFPEKSTVIATASSVDIIDADTQKLWMRFSQGTSYAIGVDANNDPSSANMLNGKAYISTNGSAATGLYTLDFAHDAAFKQNATDYRLSDTALYGRNGTNTYNVINTSNILVNITANDVSAAVIPNQPTQEVTVSGWGYKAGDNVNAYVTETVNLPYKFNSVPIISMNYAGQTATAPSTVSGCTSRGYFSAASDIPSTSDFRSTILATDGAATSASTYYCYTWTATGQVSPRQYVAVGTDGGLSTINETDQSVTNIAEGGYAVTKNVFITSNDRLYWTRQNAGATNIVLRSTTATTGTAVESSWSNSGTVPAMIPNGGSATPVNRLFVTEGTSTIDGKSNTVYASSDVGLMVFQENLTGATAGDVDTSTSSVKYYTKDYISEEMVGDIRGMWPLNNANSSSDFEDVSVKANTLTGTNITANGDSVSGVRGTATDFDGSTEYLSIADNANISIVQSKTWGAWVKATSTGDNRTIMIHRHSSTNVPQLMMGRDTVLGSGTSGSWNYTNAAGTCGWASSSVGFDTSWHFIVGSYDRSNLRLFIDGNLVATQACSTEPDPDGAFQIGAGTQSSSTSNYFNGVIDEAFVTATTLTPAQIKNMYQVGYRALQSHGTTLGGGAADTNQQLGFISTGTNVVGDAKPDYNNQFMYVGTNSTTLGAVSKIDLNSDTNIKTYNSSANVPAGGALLIDEDTKSLAVGYNLEAVGSATTGVKTMGVDNNATATSGNFIGKTITTAESFNQAYLWAQYVTDSSDASNTIQVWASNDGGSNYSQCNLTNTDSSRSPSEYEYFCQFNAPGSSLKTKFVMARGSTKTNTYITKYGISWIDSSAIAGAANGSGLYTTSGASVASGSYIDVAHNQNSNDLVTNGWVYNTTTSKWEVIDNADVAATGGTITYTDSSGLNPRSTAPYSGGYTVHTFTSSGTFTPPSGGTVEYLVVGGGGGGGGGENNSFGGQGGGGGGGGVLTGTGFAVTASAYTITVGAGGTAGNSAGTDLSTNGNIGETSVFDSLSAVGGGGGGGDANTPVNSRNGASGGGGAGDSPTAGTASAGFAGGNGASRAGGGGGGNSQVGEAATTDGAREGGDGGNGTNSSISGSTIMYGSGGGGGGNSTGGLGLGGTGGDGGGDGMTAPNNTNGAGTGGSAGTTNRGGGGGGGVNSSGFAGGSGIVIVRYLTNSLSAFKITQQDANTVRLYNYSGATQNLRLDVITGGLGRNAGTVSLAPAAADVDSQTSTNSIWINKTGSAGNLLKLQTSGTDVLSLTGAGLMTLTGNFVPGVDDTYDLGTNTARWKDIYLGPATAHIGTSTTDEGTISYDTTNNIFQFGTDATTNADIAFFTDDLYLDKSTGNVGIGTTGQLFTGNKELGVSAGVTGDVITDIVAQGARTSNAIVARFVGMSKTNAVGTMNVFRANGSDNSGDIAFNTMNAAVDAEAMRIRYNGNIGIGTTNPGSILDVGNYGTTSNVENIIRLAGRKAGANGNFADLRLSNSSDSGGSYFGIVARRESNNFGVSADFTVNNTGAGATPLTAMTLQYNGNVGIGTTGPLAKLHLSGGDGGEQFTAATIALGYSTTGQYPNFIHTRHNGGTTLNNAIDFYTSDGTAGGVFPTNAVFGMTINGGNIGIGTTNPGSILDVGNYGTTSNVENIIRLAGRKAGANGNFADLRLSNSSDSGGSYFGIVARRESNNFGVSADFTVNNTGAGATPLTAMTLQYNGNVGIGTTGPGYLLTVNSSTPGCNGCTAWTNYSDSRLKENIVNLSGDILDKIMQLNPVTFNYNDTYYSQTGYSRPDGTTPTFSGFIAQDLQQIFPEMVNTASSGYLDTNLSNLQIYLVKGIQEQQGKIASLSGQLAGLLQIDGSCVTGDTMLPIRRKKKRRNSDDEQDEYDEFLCRIDDILPDDEVLSLNETTEALEYAKINKLMDMGIKEVYELVTKSGKVIRTTANHPYLTSLEDNPIANEEKINI